uniref:Sushi domain-containing protein n=1 Tax=Strigamia maritima TaxID=126957 RepID=T1J865_STRMM
MSADRMMLIIICFAVNFLVTIAYKENCTVPNIPNGYVHELTKLNEYILLVPGDNLTHGAEILITCDEDYDLAANQLVDENFALKCNNGKLALTPYCVPRLINYEMKPGRGKFLGSSRIRDRFNRIQKVPCVYEPRDENTWTFYNGNRITQNTTFPNGADLVFRCNDISTYSLQGNMTRKCEDGKWSGKIAHCIRLYSHSFYSPPVITYDITIENDTASILENGSLIVPQHTDVTLHCLWLKDNGDPHWRKDWKYINKDEIPSLISWNENENSLDLFIPKIQLKAAGIYSCQTPNRKRHMMDLAVLPRESDEIDLELKMSSCTYVPRNWSNTLILQNGKEIFLKEQQYFPNGTVLDNICKNVLQYKMEGNKSIQCNAGKWSSAWPNCTYLTDSVDSPPALDIQITNSDKSYFVDDKGIVIVPKETTVSFICKFSGGKPVMALQGARLRQTMGQHRSGSTTAWYLRADIPTNSISFTFFCKIPRKDVNLFHSVEVIAKGSCKLEERKMQYRWRGSKIITIPGREMYVEDELVLVECDDSTTSVIPVHFRCGDKGNWIPGPNQRCRAQR